MPLFRFFFNPLGITWTCHFPYRLLFSLIFWVSLFLGRILFHFLRRRTGYYLPLVIGSVGSIFGSVILILFVDEFHWTLAISASMIGLSISAFQPNLYGILLTPKWKAISPHLSFRRGLVSKEPYAEYSLV